MNAATPEFAAAVGRRQPAGASPPAIERVLIGARGDHAEARIRIVDGSGQSIELHLVAMPDRKTISLEILALTATTGSRERLSDVMKQVRLRLRRRGIILRDDGSREASR